MLLRALVVLTLAANPKTSIAPDAGPSREDPLGQLAAVGYKPMTNDEFKTALGHAMTMEGGFQINLMMSLWCKTGTKEQCSEWVRKSQDAAEKTKRLSPLPDDHKCMSAATLLMLNGAMEDMYNRWLDDPKTDAETKGTVLLDRGNWREIKQDPDPTTVQVCQNLDPANFGFIAKKFPNQ